MDIDWSSKNKSKNIYDYIIIDLIFKFFVV